jgi:hypothetical protein
MTTTTDTPPVTVREHKTETYLRVAFDEPIPSWDHPFYPSYEITSAVVTSAVWLVDDQDGPSDEPYVTTTFYGFPLTAKGVRDKRNPRAVMVPSTYVPDAVCAAVAAMV